MRVLIRLTGALIKSCAECLFEYLSVIGLLKIEVYIAVVGRDKAPEVGQMHVPLDQFQALQCILVLGVVCKLDHVRRQRELILQSLDPGHELSFKRLKPEPDDPIGFIGWLAYVVVAF